MTIELELTAPGFGVRHLSVARHVTNCAMWPDMFLRVR